MGGGIAFSGIVTSGLGEGAVYMSMEHYKKEIKDKLGFDAYPGTLNIKTDEKINLFDEEKAVIIEGYESEGKVFYGAKCYKAKIKNINGAVLVPDKSRHDKEIIEFIAPVHLKSELGIQDGDEIRVEMG